ncbi:transposase [Lysinibacillus sphaericus OT4b.31]|uniref:Transposase n=1 Tax=Lysinibacillus sphaericus OT4b.31 TaxID=1285586 RepID=R7ZG85_LYSSH|nr:transposase [Lysinibacillus sphaericus OT4b.31]
MLFPQKSPPALQSTHVRNDRQSSIEPIVLKMTFIQYVFSIRSMRQTIKEIQGATFKYF